MSNILRTSTEHNVRQLYNIEIAFYLHLVQLLCFPDIGCSSFEPILSSFKGCSTLLLDVPLRK